jgi:ABC-type transport system involved in cytochrome bd biosynthesis fused ATPase/permease subunit
VAGLALGRAVTSPSLAIILTATLGFGLRIVAETLMAREGLAAEVQLGHRVAPVVDAAVTSPDAPAPHDIVVLEDQIINGARLEVLRGSLVATPLALGLLYVFSGWLGLLCVVGLLVASVPLYVITGRRASAGVDAYTQRRSALSRQQLRVLRSANELRALGASDFAVDSVAAASHAEHETTTAFLRRSIGSSLVTDFIAGVSIGLVAMVVGFGIFGGRESLAHALGALFVATELVTRIRRYGGEFHRRDDSQRALEAMCSIEPTAATSDGGLARREAGTTLAELDNVEVGHLASPLSLTVKANSRWVLRGASGVGKSTVLNCLVGHDTARSGRVTVPTCRVGIVRAASPLLPLTVLDNVTLRVARDDEAKDVLDQSRRQRGPL